MTKFQNLDQVKKEFLLRSRGGDKLDMHQTRYSDLDKYASVVERLLDTDYNTVSGFSFTELMEAVSLVAENYGSSDYYRAIKNDSKAMKIDESLIKEVAGEDNFWAVNEALNTTQTAQAPYPVPSIALTTYQYEKSVIPYLCHQFDLKGNRGLVYFQKITAGEDKGAFKTGDLLGSPKEMSKQTYGFAGTKNTVDNESLGKATPSGQEGDTTATLEKTLDMVPVQPGSLVVRVPGSTAYFKDFAFEGSPDEVALYSVGGDLGKGTLNRATGELKITLNVAPTGQAAAEDITCSYRADIQGTKDADGNRGTNIAKVQVSLDSKQLEAEDFSIFTETSIYQEALSKAIFGLDWNNQVDEALAALYNKEIANKIVAEIRDQIPAESQKTHDVSATIAATGTGDNKLFNVQFLSVVMGNLGKLITKASGIGNNKLSALVMHIDVLPLMRALPKFTAANADFEEVMGGMYLAGLYDGMPVIVGYGELNEEGNGLEPGFGPLAPGEIIGLYKSKNKDFLAPYAWGTFILPIIRDIFDQDNLAVNRKQLIASAAGEVVAERLAAKIAINGIDTILG